MEKFQNLLKARLHGDQSMREQIPQLCAAMLRVRLPLQSSSDIGNAVTALACMNPLQPIWKDVQKKSRVQHVMCDMLNAVLAPVANEGVFFTLLFRFYVVVVLCFSSACGCF